MLTLIPVLIQLLEAGITVVPQIISAAKLEYGLFTSNTAPTPEQQKQIDDALDAANQALQAA